jgi:hypothetical protein
MPTETKNPTANETPDSSQIVGDVAVTGASNTGHASTTASAILGALEDKTCRWSGFAATPGGNLTATLKVTHTSSGSLAGPTPNNRFTLEYTLNGGGAWTTAVDRLDFTASEGPTVFSVALSPAQDLTQVQVRDVISALSNGALDVVSATATISDIKIEITRPQYVVSMM